MTAQRWVLGLLAVIAAGVVTIAAVLLLDRGETTDDRAEEPKTSASSSTPREWPTFATAQSLLDAAARAGVDVCPNPMTPKTGTLAIDLLSCDLYTERFVSARIYADEVGQGHDVKGFRELAGYELEDGNVPSSVLIGPREGGRPLWLLAGPTDQLRGAAEELGGGLIDLTVPSNVIVPTED